MYTHVGCVCQKNLVSTLLYTWLEAGFDFHWAKWLEVRFLSVQLVNTAGCFRQCLELSNCAVLRSPRVKLRHYSHEGGAFAVQCTFRVLKCQPCIVQNAWLDFFFAKPDFTRLEGRFWIRLESRTRFISLESWPISVGISSRRFSLRKSSVKFWQCPVRGWQIINFKGNLWFATLSYVRRYR